MDIGARSIKPDIGGGSMAFVNFVTCMVRLLVGEMRCLEAFCFSVKALDLCCGQISGR